VLKDEILRYAQSDKGELGPTRAALCRYVPVSEGDFAASQPVASATGRPVRPTCQATPPRPPDKPYTLDRYPLE
ncbi:MAG TPA: hypothetical protein VEY08_13680, partial [Chloroflexia bacterium]|nr:hypothetical protein [Chloroflexia bacterium]